MEALPCLSNNILLVMTMTLTMIVVDLSGQEPIRGMDSCPEWAYELLIGIIIGVVIGSVASTGALIALLVFGICKAKSASRSKRDYSDINQQEELTTHYNNSSTDSAV